MEMADAEHPININIVDPIDCFFFSVWRAINWNSAACRPHWRRRLIFSIKVDCFLSNYPFLNVCVCALNSIFLFFVVVLFGRLAEVGLFSDPIRKNLAPPSSEKRPSLPISHVHRKKGRLIACFFFFFFKGNQKTIIAFFDLR